jgi:nucleoside-diphosphate-sugar epimerase
VTSTQPAVGITGASGYLGGLIRRSFDASDWRTVALVRSPSPDDRDARRYDLADDVSDDVFGGLDTIVHCAYDLTLHRPADIDQVNVEGTRRMLEAAGRAGVRRVIVLSSMSAYDGTTQIYGRAKLAIEAATLAAGGAILRPGLVYGPRPGGMADALRKLARLPLVPVPSGDSRQYTVHEDDLAAAVVAVAQTAVLPTVPVSVASPHAVAFRGLLSEFARSEGRNCRFVRVPWKWMYWSLRLGEMLPVGLPVRADSMLGLVKPAPGLVGIHQLQELGVQPRDFALAGPVYA